MELLVPTTALTQLPFQSACYAWLESRRHHLAPRTFEEYELNIKTLAKFFSELRLQEIDGDLLRTYQRMRMATVGPVSINHECGLLCLIRKRIGMPLTDYQPLPMPKSERGRALSEEQRARLLRIASSNPNWEAVYLFAVISVNTSAGPKETYTLRLKDVDIEKAIIRIQPEGAKNPHRIRTIPLNDEALLGVKMAIERANRLGSVQPDHYLFPFRINRSLYDPTRHQSHFNKTWSVLRDKAQLPGFRMYDLRHHAITSMLENPDISEETVEDIAGHVSRKMKKRYSHIRMEYKRAAVEAMIQKQRAPKKPSKSEDDLAQQLLSALAKLLKAG
jgi:integrase